MLNCGSLISGQIQNVRKNRPTAYNNSNFATFAASTQSQFSNQLQSAVSFLNTLVTTVSTLINNAQAIIFLQNLSYFYNVSMSQSANLSTCQQNYGTNTTTTVINNNIAIGTAISNLNSALFTTFSNMLTPAFNCTTNAISVLTSAAQCSTSSDANCYGNAVSLEIWFVYNASHFSLISNWLMKIFKSLAS